MDKMFIITQGKSHKTVTNKYNGNSNVLVKKIIVATCIRESFTKAIPYYMANVHEHKHFSMNIVSFHLVKKG